MGNKIVSTAPADFKLKGVKENTYDVAATAYA